MLKQAKKMAERADSEANNAISKLPIEQQEAAKSLLKRAKKGDISVDELIKEINKWDSGQS